jgi:hypothetical protein
MFIQPLSNGLRLAVSEGRAAEVELNETQTAKRLIVGEFTNYVLQI